MRAPGLLEAADQGVVRGFEKHQRRLEVVARESSVHGGKLAQRFPAPNIDHHGGALDAAVRLAAALGKLGDQIHRQVIDAVEAQVLERLQDRAFARPAESGDENELSQRSFLNALHQRLYQERQALLEHETAVKGTILACRKVSLNEAALPPCCFANSRWHPLTRRLRATLSRKGRGP